VSMRVASALGREDVGNERARLLGLGLVLKEAWALKHIEVAMRTAKGSVRVAAASLGVHEGSLSRWLRLPQLAKAAAFRQGRAAVGARSKTKAARTAKAKTARSRKGSRE
jgi:hypothetical protein